MFRDYLYGGGGGAEMAESKGQKSGRQNEYLNLKK
jgi:hypothetical protein